MNKSTSVGWRNNVRSVVGASEAAGDLTAFFFKKYACLSTIWSKFLLKNAFLNV